MARKSTPHTTPAAETRDDTPDTAVTELASVDGGTKTSTLEKMAGVADEPYKPAEEAPTGPSQQQQDALDGLKQAKDDAKGKDRDELVNPFAQGPGSDIA